MKYIKILKKKKKIIKKELFGPKNISTPKEHFYLINSKEKMEFIKDTLNKDKKYIDTKRTFLSQLKGRSAKLDTGRKPGYV